MHKKVIAFIKKHRIHVFGIGSFIGFLIQYLLTIILSEYTQIGERRAYALSLIVGLLIIFNYHRLITFKIEYHCNKMMSKFLSIYALSNIINWNVVATLIFFIDYRISIIIVSMTLVPFNYLICKHIIFKECRTKN